MTEDTYEIPKHGWTCFHCGETFKNMGGARDHFGALPTAVPGCMIRVQLGPERGLLMALRKVEDRLARYMDDDSDIQRAMQAMQSRHGDQLQAAEELGYARGLAARRE